ncbi:MAG TPA: DNA cytosine methyltransferase [Planctomycetaceae bacterium]|nr:DNA cytosine methyltransferase [Planctomycetaceae bacterium]HQZ68724.1 DNA cytosine methyltransferase [Planctomycetaceae bacterium]
MRTVSIFCGCGGFDLGFKSNGFEIVYACDNDKLAVDCYCRNVDDRAFVRDVTSDLFHAEIKELGSCDLVLGGFPCQGFSKAGPKRESDLRNMLYLEMLAVVRELRPRLFLAENVDGLSQNFQGSFLKQIVADFRRIGYEVEHRIVDAAAFGVPQHRRRIVFAGYPATNQSAGFPWPVPTHFVRARNGDFKVKTNETQPSLFDLSPQTTKTKLRPARTIRDAIDDLVELTDSVADHAITNAWPKKYEAVFRAISPGQKLCNVRHAKTSVYSWQIPEVFGEVSERQSMLLETISKHRRHKRYGDIPNGNPLPIEEIERLSGLTEIFSDIESLLSRGYLKAVDEKFDLKGAMFCSGLFKRPTWDEPSPTVLTNFHNPRYFLHPAKDRPFSLRECARLQSFPDSFKIMAPGSGIDLVTGYRLIGNAVPPLFAAAFAKSVEEFLCSDRSGIEVAP